MTTEFPYDITVTWTGDRGSGTSGHEGYARDHTVTAPGPHTPIAGSADTGAFRGDAARWNPEQLLTAAVAQCHLLWYLHLCAAEGVVVTSYEDHARGLLSERGGEPDHFSEVALRPRVRVADPAMVDMATKLHDAAREKCFVTNSVRFPVRVQPIVSA
ncbi:OsmC family peroxiredoxin [Streptomyces sp. A7024]|uniref:OsmC family peroxiredoxin n=1 Tax=Streptomyces coryli TaxID=1128680 RepID=A0A6G4TZ05_9ACTN|nr:OsmC family peroxiredoxin [Streptomyces coryli]